MTLRNCWISYTRRSETLWIPRSQGVCSNADKEAPIQLQYTHGVLALPSNFFPPLAAICHVLLSAAASSWPLRRINPKIADLAMTQKQARQNTISLFFTLHCIFEFCVSKPRYPVAINLSLVNTVQNYIILNLIAIEQQNTIVTNPPQDCKPVGTMDSHCQPGMLSLTSCLPAKLRSEQEVRRRQHAMQAKLLCDERHSIMPRLHETLPV